MVETLAVHGLTLAAALVVAAGGLALGAALLRLLRIAPAASLLTALAAWAVGMGVLAQLWLVLGLAQLYGPGVARLVLGLLLLAGGYELLRHRQTWREFVRARVAALRRFSTLEVYLLLTVALLAGFSLAGAFLPPFSLDILKYHLAAPAQYVRSGGLYFVPHFFFQQPYGAAGFNAWSLLLGLENLGALLNAFCAPAIALVLYSGGRRFMVRPAALLAAVLFYVLPGAWDYSYAHMPDLGLILFATVAFFAFVAWTESRRPGELALAACCAGLAAAYKIIGFYVVFALGVMIVVALLRRWPGWRAALLALATAATAGVAAGGLWYLRNWLVAGNPVWPVFFPMLGGRCWNATAYRDGLDAITGGYTLIGRGPLALIAGPVALLVGYGREAVFAVRPGLGPLFALLVPAALLIQPLRRRYGWLWLFVLLYYIAWFPFSQYGRFYLPAYVLLLLPMSDGVVWLAQRAVGDWRRYVGIGAAVVTGCWIFFVSLWLGGRTLLYLPAVVGLESRTQFLEAATSFYQDIQWMNEQLPEDALVLSDHVWLYYLKRPYIWNQRGLQGFFDYSQIQGRTELHQILVALGVTHVFVYLCPDCEGCTTCISDPTQRLIHDFLNEEANLVYMNREARVPQSVARRTTTTAAVAVYALPQAESTLTGEEEAGSASEICPATARAPSR